MAVHKTISYKNNNAEGYPTSVYDALVPVQIFLKIFAGSCYYQNYLGEFKKSFLLFLNSIVFIAAETYNSYRYFTSGHVNDFSRGFGFANYLQKLLYINNPLLIVFSQIMTEKKIETILTLEKIDETFLATDQKLKILEANEAVKVQSKKVMVIVLVSYSIMSITTQLVNDEEKYWYHAIKHVVILMPMLANITEFAAICTLIQTRFKMINDIFEEKIKESRNIDKYPINSTFFIRSLEVLMNQHEKLRDLTKIMNTSFNFLLLATPLNTLTIFVVKGIKIIFAILSSDINDLIPTVEWAVDIYFFVTGLAIVCYYVNALIGEANNTLQLMHGIQIRVDDTETIKMMILSTIYIANNKLKLSAFGLFNVDYSLLFYICGGAISYLVITYQFLLYTGKPVYINSTVLPTEFTLLTNEP